MNLFHYNNDSNKSTRDHRLHIAIIRDCFGIEKFGRNSTYYFIQKFVSPVLQICVGFFSP